MLTIVIGEGLDERCALVGVEIQQFVERSVRVLVGAVRFADHEVRMRTTLHGDRLLWGKTKR